MLSESVLWGGVRREGSEGGALSKEGTHRGEEEEVAREQKERERGHVTAER